jgi:hypothetical protein
MTRMKRKKPNAAKQAMYDDKDMRCPITGHRPNLQVSSSPAPLVVKIVKLPKARR